MTPNHLSDQTSPYLLQHAHNPVDWHPWGEPALTRARVEDKPIFLSIGYAACHWCHVMAHESFEDETTAALLNQNFIPIKVDREERPDLDGIYMQAVTALTGGGGWPLSVFLTPDLHPFYGGTYFPPVPRHNLPSFRDVLTSLADAWRNRRADIEKAGSQLLQHLQSQAGVETGLEFTNADLDSAEKNLLDTYDWGYGGWGSAPKFPQPMVIEFLLARNHASAPDNKSLQAALHALKVMSRGGMYDVVGGGFARYSTDNFWRIPHFEKMLYDNAQLARAYLHAWQTTRDPSFLQVVEGTLDFVIRELTHPDGGFYSSLDADSEGEEGKYYAWTKDEIQDALADTSDFELFSAAYGITEKGNWESRTILQRALDDASLAARFSSNPAEISSRLSTCHAQLLSIRNQRVPPATDDKILTSWNGLMLAAFAEAARVLANHTGDISGIPSTPSLHSRYYKLATRNAEFLLTHLIKDGHLRRSWRDGKCTGEVFLEDYASLVISLLELYQSDFNPRWFASARDLTDKMIERFADSASGFFDTPTDAESLPVRPRDLQDNALPSGNALAIEALLKLSEFTGNGKYRDLAEASLRQVTSFSVRYPTAFGRWLFAAWFAQTPVKQLAIISSPAPDSSVNDMLALARENFRPDLIVASSSFPPPVTAPDLLHDRPLLKGQATAYLCEGFVCRNPVSSPADLQKLLADTT
jgi:uncharacterized protein YyaL (SSP411 family)